MKKVISIYLVLLIGIVGLKSCFSSSYENGELSIFLPGEYISDAAIEQFEYEYDVKVLVTTFESNESMYTKLLTGAQYDIIIPSDYMAERLIKEKLVTKLDKEKLTCLDSLYDGCKKLPFDRNNDYSVPYFWGVCGICYDSTIVDSKDVEEQGWGVFHNKKYAGQIYMYDSIRDQFMTAFKDLGYSMNTNNEVEIDRAYKWLCKVADTMEPAYASDECIDGLAYGEKAMGFMYSGDAAYILNENENMRFFAPEGTNYFTDVMMIQSGSNNIENAYKFINYITDYDAAFENTSFVGYTSVNKYVLKDITSTGGDYEGNEAYIPKTKGIYDEVFNNNEEQLKVISELWVKVKNR